MFQKILIVIYKKEPMSFRSFALAETEKGNKGLMANETI